MTLALHPATRFQNRSLARAAGVAYVGAWVVGLAVGESAAAPALDAPAAEILRHYDLHAATAITQEVLVHGIAAVALAVVAATALSRRRSAMVAGLVAAALSFVQLACGIALAGGASATLFDVMNRVDGVKMFVLAAMIGLGAPLVSRWVRRTGAVAVPTLAVAGAGFLLLHPTLGMVAAPALLLLLVWVAAAPRTAR